jgi:peptidoglycan/xylan/chitin deacetylase (PgdA/CDA1 family)
MPTVIDPARKALAALHRYAGRRRPVDVGLILMYHVLAPIAGDPRRELVPALSTEVFRHQLRHVARHYAPVELRHLRDRMAERRWNEPIPTAITFDDDLRSHLDIAAPLLAAHGLPATFFVGGCGPAGAWRYWWQYLDACARHSAAALDELRSGLADEWRWASEGDIHALASRIESLSPAERDAISARIAALSPVPPPTILDTDGIRALASYGFEIGFHTRGHYSLLTLDANLLSEELQAGLEPLAGLAHARPVSIAYPHCRADARIAGAAAAAGFQVGVVCSTGPASASQNPLLLDRMNAWSPSVATFALNVARATISAT